MFKTELYKRKSKLILIDNKTELDSIKEMVNNEKTKKEYKLVNINSDLKKIPDYLKIEILLDTNNILDEVKQKRQLEYKINKYYDKFNSIYYIPNNLLKNVSTIIIDNTVDKNKNIIYNLNYFDCDNNEYKLPKNLLKNAMLGIFFITNINILNKQNIETNIEITMKLKKMLKEEIFKILKKRENEILENYIYNINYFNYNNIGYYSIK